MIIDRIKNLGRKIKIEAKDTFKRGRLIVLGDGRNKKTVSLDRWKTYHDYMEIEEKKLQDFVNGEDLKGRE